MLSCKGCLYTALCSFKPPRACCHCLLSFSLPTAVKWELLHLNPPKAISINLSISFIGVFLFKRKKHGKKRQWMLSGVFGHQLQLLSPACPCPCPRGAAVSHTAYSLMFFGGPALTCVPNWEPHTAPLGLIPALQCLLCPHRSIRAASLPQNAHTILWMHWPSFCAQLGFHLSLWAPWVQLADTPA